MKDLYCKKQFLSLNLEPERPTNDMMTENGDGVSMSNWAFGQQNQIQPESTDTPELSLSGRRIDAWECQEKFEDTKGVIRNHKSRTDRHDNDQKKIKVKMTNNDLQSITQKINDWARRTQLKTGGELSFNNNNWLNK